MNSGNGGKAPQVMANHMVVLFRPKDGRVLHLHTIRVFEGGRKVSREEAEEELRVQATHLGHDLGVVKIAHIVELPQGRGSLYYDSATNTLKRSEISRNQLRKGRH